MKPFKEMTVDELKWLHEQIEGTLGYDPNVLKQIREELFNKGVTHFHGRPIAEVLAHNPAFKAEFESWKKKQKDNQKLKK